MTDRNYTVQTKINCPVATVFNAVANEDAVDKYFVDKTSGPLLEGDRVVWYWNEFGEYPVVVTKVVENKLIELELDTKEWKKTTEKSYTVIVRLEFDSLDEQTTMLSISEQGWLTDQTGLRGSHDNCSGWTHMAMCLKGFLEHGLNLRQ